MDSQSILHTRSTRESKISYYNRLLACRERADATLLKSICIAMVVAKFKTQPMALETWA